MLMLTRRELTLLLFCLTVYILFYNVDTSLHLVSISYNQTAQNTSATSLFGLKGLYRPDGRRKQEYFDEMEREMLGDWEVDGPRKYVYDLGPHGKTAHQVQMSWSQSPPATEILAHVPGFTVLQNVYVANATIFLVSDVPETFPKLELMLSSAEDYTRPPRVHDLQVISTSSAYERIGDHASRMTGISWLCSGPASLHDNQTFLSLARAHSVFSQGHEPAPPPDQTFLMQVPIDRLGTSGFDTRLARAVFPFMRLNWFEDWDDLHGTNKPFFFDRVVLADRGAALRGAPTFDFGSVTLHRSLREMTPKVQKRRTSLLALEAPDRSLSFAPPFALPVEADWWTKIRSQFAEFAVLPTDDSKTRTMTYVSAQRRMEGLRLRTSDHLRLVSGLEGLASKNGWHFHLVELGADENIATPWIEHARTASLSSVMLGVHGDALTNSVFMKPQSPVPTLMEFFPKGVYSNEHEFVSRALGMDYIAWQENRKFHRGSLPPISQASASASQEISIDVPAVINAVRDQMKRS